MTLAIIILDDETTDEAVAEFATKLKPGIREILRRGTKTSSGDLADSISVHVENRNVIRISSSEDYAVALDRGTRSRIMWSLINKIVPLKLPGGTTIFRRVTLASLIRGKWRYPGTPGLNFIEKGAQLAQANTEGQIGYRIQKPPPVVATV